MIILLMAFLLNSDRPAQTFYMAGVETLLEAFMIAALIAVQ